MDEGKRSNKTILIVICLIVVLLCGCMMGSLVGGLAGFGIGRRVVANGASVHVPERVTVEARGTMGGLPSAESGAIAVTQVVSASPAEKAGLVAGDIITALENQNLTVANTLANRLLLYKPGDTVRMSVLRAGQRLEVTVVLGANPDQATRAWLGIYYQQAPATPRLQEPD